MDNVLAQRIARARQLLGEARHAAMATVNADGTPHNTPFFYMVDEALGHIYFGSHPQSVHTQNVLRTGHLFVVLYDIKQSGGLYLKAIGGHELMGSERTKAAGLYNAARISQNKKPVPDSYYGDATPQRLYGAKIVGCWVNVAARDEQGIITREQRQEISPQDLISL